MTNGQSSILNPQSIFYWSQPTLTWLPVAADETLPAGTVLWVYASTNTTLALYGAYSDPTSRLVAAGPSFQPAAGLEALSPPVPGADNPLWRYDAARQGWEFQAAAFPGSDSGLPEFIAPGQATFILANG